MLVLKKINISHWKLYLLAHLISGLRILTSSYIDAILDKNIMLSQKAKIDLVIAGDNLSFTPGYLEALYPQMSPYTRLERQGGRSRPTSRTLGHSSDESLETLILSPSEAVQLGQATSGFFRDFMKKE